jgi:ribosomal protein S4
LEDILNRRLQTIVYIKGLAKSPKQSRQFIIHKHIMVGNRRLNVPSYFVKKSEEGIIAYSEFSPLADEMHPMRHSEEPDGEMDTEKEITNQEESENKSSAKKTEKSAKPKSENKKEETAKEPKKENSDDKSNNKEKISTTNDEKDTTKAEVNKGSEE